MIPNSQVFFHPMIIFSKIAIFKRALWWKCPVLADFLLLSETSATIVFLAIATS